MTTKTFHDIYDLTDLVSTLENGQIEISTQDGRGYFSVINYTKESQTDAFRAEYLKLEDASAIRAFAENIDAAYRAVEDKIVSGEWKKSDDPA